MDKQINPSYFSPVSVHTEKLCNSYVYLMNTDKGGHY